MSNTNFQIVCFNNLFSTKIQSNFTSFDDFCQELEAKSQLKADKKESLPMYCLAPRGEDGLAEHKAGIGVRHIQGVVLDIDKVGVDEWDELSYAIQKSGRMHFFHETFNSAPSNGQIRARIVLPFEVGVKVGEIDYRQTVLNCCQAIDQTGGLVKLIDSCSYEPTHRYFYPCNGVEIEYSVLGDGWDRYKVGSTKTVDVVAKNVDLKGRNNYLKARVLWCIAKTPVCDGVREVNMEEIATHIYNLDLERHEVPLFTDPSEGISKKPNPPLEFVKSIVKSANSAVAYPPVTEVDTPTHDPISGASLLWLKDNRVDYSVLDKGNAERFIHQYGNEVKWVKDVEKWASYNWDKGVWEYCEYSTFNKFMLACISSYDKDIEELKLGKRDSDMVSENELEAEGASAVEVKLKSLMKARTACHRTSVIKSGMNYAKSIKDLWLDSTAFDSRDTDLLLNFNNGTYNLKTCEFEAHNPSHYITLSTDLTYDPTASSPMIEKLVADMFEEEETRDFVKRWFGHNLMGLNPEKKLLLLYGPTANNGKSTLQNAMSMALGAYGCSTQASTILELNNKFGGGNGHNHALAILENKRGVFISELPEGGKLNENAVKQITGDADLITASKKYEAERSFYFKGKITLASNNMPVLSSDSGIWKRLLLLECKVSFDNPDLNFKDKLFGERIGIINWLIEGWKEYKLKGLTPSPEMDTIKAQEAEKVFTVKGFIDQACVRGKQYTCLLSEAYSAYVQHCAEADYYICKKPKFEIELAKLGIKTSIGRSRFKVLEGIKLNELGNILYNKGMTNFTSLESELD